MTSSAPSSVKPVVAPERHPIATPAGSPVYWPALDGLRTVAFTLVFCHHMYDVRGLSHPRMMALVASKLVSFGWIGVDLFFVISGFLMTSLLSQEYSRFGNINALKFYARRGLRIWPAFLAVMSFLFFVIPQMSGAEWNTSTWWHFVSIYNPLTLLFIGNYTSMADCSAIFATCHRFQVDVGATLLTPLWSLCIEEQFYLVLPLLLTAFVTPRRRLALFAVILVSSILLRVQVTLQGPAISHDAWYRNTFCHLDAMMIGCIIATLNKEFELIKRAKPFAGIIAGLAASSLVGLVAVLPTIANAPVWSLGLFAIALCFGALLIAACASPGLSRVFSNRWLSAIGKKTYAMYLWHCFVIGQVTVLLAPVLSAKWNTPLGWCIEWSAAYAATFAVASVSWALIEGPANRLKSNFERH